MSLDPIVLTVNARPGGGLGIIVSVVIAGIALTVYALRPASPVIFGR